MKRRVALKVLSGGTAALGFMACGGQVELGNDAGGPSDPNPLDPGPGATGTATDTATGTETGGSCGELNVAPLEKVPDAYTYFINGTTRSALIIGLDEGGYFAMTGACTHARCALQQKGSGATGYWYCRCHGARFTYQGVGTTKVAPKPLQHYALSVCSDGFYVDLNAPVDAETRSPK